MSGLALPEAVAGAHVDAQQDATTGPFLSHTALDGTHSNSPNNGSEMDKRLKPGLLVAVSVDPIATLRPLFEGDDAIEKAAWEMFPRMRRYIAFLRDVESLQKCVADHGDELEGDPIIETEDMPLLAGTGVHLNLMHTQRPSRSRYDTIDESMSVPLYVERPSSPTAPASLPQRQNSRRYPGLVRTSARKPIVAQSTNGSLPWKELYAHTIMDAFAAVSDVDAASPRNGDLSSFELSMKDMQRYDGYQAVDRARESNQSQKVHANGGDPVDIVDDWDMEEDEEEDESQFRLSTVISGLTMEEDYSVPDQARDASMSFALPGRHPSSRVASPVSSGVAPSAWKGKQIRLHQPQRPQLDYITATDAQVPQFQEPLSPKSPTMTGASGETSDSKHTNLSSASTPTSISPSTQATSVPDHLISSIPAPLECQVEEARNDNEAAPWDFTRLDLGGGLGSNKPLDRRCAIHVRIWLDLGNEDMREPEDPRTFFEELKMLRAYVLSPMIFTLSNI
jgi:hypothetical protein